MNAAPIHSDFPPEHRHVLPPEDAVLSDTDGCLAEHARDEDTSAADIGNNMLGIPDRDALYAEIQPLVQRLLVRYGKTPELRRDLRGEIYCRFCRLVAEYDPNRGIPIRPYVVCKLEQQVFNYVRGHWRVVKRVAPLDLPDGAERDLTVVRSDNDPLQQILTRELLDALPGSISVLPYRQRMIILFRFFEGLTYEEIADRMGVKVVSVRSLQRFALAALRRKMRLNGLVNR